MIELLAEWRRPQGARDRMADGLRALSIRQPWAWAILYGGKRVENRSWYTAYRGPIYLHAGLQVDRGAEDGLADVILAVPEPRPPAYRGAVLGIAELVDCVPISEVPAGQQDWSVGPWCFILEGVRALERPVAAKGALGIFTLEAAAELRLLGQTL
jgi:hypothetical protein